jgi:hypothetical protein
MIGEIMGTYGKIIDLFKLALQMQETSEGISIEEIQQEFGISKKAFKKVIGGLFRQGRILINNDGIRLAPKKEQRRYPRRSDKKNFRSR